MWQRYRYADTDDENDDNNDDGDHYDDAAVEFLG